MAQNPFTHRKQIFCTLDKFKIPPYTVSSIKTVVLYVNSDGLMQSSEMTSLEMRNISKSFGANLVLDQVSLLLHRAEVLAFLGENGAGKSTLIKILAGIYPKDAGTIVFDEFGEIESAAAISGLNYRPIAFIHQDLGLIDWMTIAENMAFSLGFPKRKTGLIDWKKAEQQASLALQQIGVKLSPRTRVFRLTQAEKAIVAIARALAGNARLLVLDEPTASLPAEDVHKLFEIIANLKKQGVGMIYVTHRMDEVAQISDRVLIIRDGQVVADCQTQAMDTGEMVARIVGKKQKDQSFKAPKQKDTDSCALEVQNLRIGALGPVSFRLAAGELLGLVGLRGAGHEKIGRSLFGLEAECSGYVQIRGGEAAPDYSWQLDGARANMSKTKYSPKHAIQHGISLLAANRGSESLVLSMSVEENLLLNQQNHGYWAWCYYTLKQMCARSKPYIEQLDIHPDDPCADISALSGGNQQKVVISRWLDIGNNILILEDPTAGVDVGARAEIYQLFLQLLASGKSLLLISSDFEEVAKLCPRVLVFNKNQISRELCDDEVTHEQIFHHASL